MSGGYKLKLLTEEQSLIAIDKTKLQKMNAANSKEENKQEYWEKVEKLKEEAKKQGVNFKYDNHVSMEDESYENILKKAVLTQARSLRNLAKLERQLKAQWIEAKNAIINDPKLSPEKMADKLFALNRHYNQDLTKLIEAKTKVFNSLVGKTVMEANTKDSEKIDKMSFKDLISVSRKIAEGKK